MYGAFPHLQRILSERGLGKRTQSDLYAHRTVIGAAAAEIEAGFLLTLDEQWRSHAKPELPLWNILKISRRSNAYSLLSYPDFDHTGHPTLAASLVVRGDSEQPRFTDYRSRSNLPVLHRKELLVAPDYPHANRFHELSIAEDTAGLLIQAHTVGYQAQWEQRLTKAGYRVEGHRLART